MLGEVGLKLVLRPRDQSLDGKGHGTIPPQRNRNNDQGGEMKAPAVVRGFPR